MTVDPSFQPAWQPNDASSRYSSDRPLEPLSKGRSPSSRATPRVVLEIGTAKGGTLGPTESPARVHVASAGAAWLVELAALTARRHSSIPIELVVGDSVGNLGPTVERLRRGGPVALEVAPGRAHALWLDHWIAASGDGYPVFLDSDVFLRRGCWISPLLAALEGGAALVSCEISERVENVVEPVRGAVTTAMPRPAPWLMAADAAAVRATGASFAYANRTEDGETIAYDVGGIALEALRAAGRRAEALPPGYRSYYSHIGGMSWRRSPAARAEPRRWLRARYARALLLGERIAARARRPRHAAPSSV